MKNPFYIALSLSLLCSPLYAQQPTQTIRGTIIDNASQAPLPFVNIVVLNTEPLMGATSDTLGNFALTNVPIGRHDLKATFIGYEPALVREVIVSSAKEAILTIPLTESFISLGEVVITPSSNKEQPLNAMATASAKMLSVEEAKRYAGGFDDPARLASSFAGVASNTGNNGITVRGNAPKFLQWKMEGVEIPNPNHFADLAVFGGGGLTALSSQMLANSDFFTGAFPAEYHNALSGVFDIAMRNGNHQKYEHTIQVGVVGIDVASEGPLKKGGDASYLFNYRYATLSLLKPLLPENGDGVSYQDISFKWNVPTKKAGIFSLWGIGLADSSGAEAKTDSAAWAYFSDKEEQKVKQYMGAMGLSHSYFFNTHTRIKTILAATASKIDLTTHQLDAYLNLLPREKIHTTHWNFVFSSAVNTKVNTRHTNRTGVVVTGLNYDVLLKNAPAAGDALQPVADAQGFSALVSAYTNSLVRVSEKLVMTLGGNGQWFALNKHYTIEPRLGLRWQFKPQQSLGIAYGLHSRIEPLNYYFNTPPDTGEEAVNKNLDFTKAHHFVGSYDWSISEVIHLKVEPYYQRLFNVPVIADSSFSLLNLQNDWFFAEKLQNKGQGRNYGIDLTFEKYMAKGYYFLISGSVFNSEYKGGDGIWRNTRYNRKYLLNVLFGKEWRLGKKKQQTLSLNTRLSYQGGDRYSPINETASTAIKEVVYDEMRAFEKQAQASFIVHFTGSYKIHKKNTAHEIALKIINATGQKDFLGHQYHLLKNTVEQHLEAIVVPNLSYKIEF
jgi:CarboxypepD_reg-like domain